MEQRLEQIHQLRQQIAKMDQQNRTMDIVISHFMALLNKAHRAPLHYSAHGDTKCH